VKAYTDPFVEDREGFSMSPELESPTIFISYCHENGKYDNRLTQLCRELCDSNEFLPKRAWWASRGPTPLLAEGTSIGRYTIRRLLGRAIPPPARPAVCGDLRL
jgi:hypothetical protein